MTSPSRDLALTAELVRLCHRDVADPGPADDPYDYFTDADYDSALRNVLQSRPPGPLWIFAYGSLIWKPEVPSIESRRARAVGWHRAFSLVINRWRGSSDQPGYMMCLDRGGHCDGVAFRLAEDMVEPLVLGLLRREVGSAEAMEAVRWIDLETESGTVRALVFYAAPEHIDSYTPGVPLDDVAYRLARACGHLGSGAEYLRNTVLHLEELGLRDDHLWLLQERVAAEIRKMHKTGERDALAAV